MKHIVCVQNTEEWFRERLGKPTASSFDKIVKKDCGLSSQRFDYMYRLIWERIYKKQANIIPPNYWMARGKALEPIARVALSKALDQKISSIGLLTTDDGRIASSPDGIVDWSHAVEIKCPKPWQHIQYSVLGPGADYLMQIQGHMYVGEFEQVSFFSFCPGMPCVVHTIKRNKGIIDKLAAILPLFADEVDKHEKKARELGNYYDVEPDEQFATREQATAWEQEASY